MAGRTRRKILFGVVGLAALGAAGPTAFRSVANARGLATRTRAGLALGTTVALTVAGRDAAALDSALDGAFKAIRAVEAAASLFRTDSALARLNREGSLRTPDPLLMEMLRFGLALAEASGGAFDPTVQPLWNLWAGAAAAGGRPDDAALHRAVAQVGWRRIALGADAVRLEPGMGVTLNGLVQGFAADRVMAVLDAHGIADAFVDTGEFGARGAHADGTPWRLGLADPAEPARIADILAPFAGFASTSGDYAMGFSPDHADHHIFDPKTGRSPAALASVTVTAPTGLLADGLSTAAMVLGETEGRRLVSLYPGCTVRFTAKKSA